MVGDDGVEEFNENNVLEESAGENATLKQKEDFQAPPHQMTLGDLITAYQTDKVSTYHKLRYQVRKNQDSKLRRLSATHGHIELRTIKHRHLIEWHLDWTKDGKMSMAHSFIAAIRTLCGFGASMLENEQCDRISLVLHRLRFPHSPPRIDRLTFDQANAIRGVARDHFGWPSISLAQALQFELLLRQKDVIGEWVPADEPGDSYVQLAGKKWLRGLLWEEINDKFILVHKTSKRQKDLTVDLKLAPCVVDEFNDLGPGALTVDEQTGLVTAFDRSLLPERGPIILNDLTAYPWSANEYRRKWRLVADKAKVPRSVKNMDSRAGGITEATEAGADLEHVKHAATHSDIAQTQRYSRNANDKIESVQKSRIQFRNKKKFLHGE